MTEYDDTYKIIEESDSVKDRQVFVLLDSKFGNEEEEELPDFGGHNLYEMIQFCMESYTDYNRISLEESLSSLTSYLLVDSTIAAKLALPILFSHENIHCEEFQVCIIDVLCAISIRVI